MKNAELNGPVELIAEETIFKYAYGKIDKGWKHCWQFWRGDLSREHMFIQSIINHYEKRLEEKS